MPFAVIKTGGKQYIVAPGQKLKIEKLPQKAGEEVVFDQVLLSERDGKIEIGSPFVKDAKVNAKVLSQGKGEKLVDFHFRNKKRYKKKKGHRQLFTEVEITSI
ncbi:MAG: 50S ribosomal protein L21 [Candidatus Wildermuthbacteria bacterium]|nr:50S ribosomal protein L21 [Candidatus Wildermuthbacteria bacterium]